MQWCHLADSLSESLLGGDAAILGTLVRFSRARPNRSFTGIKDLGHFLACGGLAAEEITALIQQPGGRILPCRRLDIRGFEFCPMFTSAIGIARRRCVLFGVDSGSVQNRAVRF